MRRKRNNSGEWYSLHALPFLSIMLGLISVMALTSMAITVERRKVAKKAKYVELAKIPSNIIPVHIICGKSAIAWKETSGIWRSFSFNRQEFGSAENLKLINEFMLYIRSIAHQNHKLSFADKQHSIILWIRPDGIQTASQLQGIISELGVPLRTGMLPLLSNEKLKSARSRSGL